MGHEKKTLSSDFAYFLTAIRKMLRALVMLTSAQAYKFLLLQFPFVFWENLTKLVGNK